MSTIKRRRSERPMLLTIPTGDRRRGSRLPESADGRTEVARVLSALDQWIGRPKRSASTRRERAAALMQVAAIPGRLESAFAQRKRVLIPAPTLLVRTRFSMQCVVSMRCRMGGVPTQKKCAMDRVSSSGHGAFVSSVGGQLKRRSTFGRSAAKSILWWQASRAAARSASFQSRSSGASSAYASRATPRIPCDS